MPPPQRSLAISEWIRSVRQIMLAHDHGEGMPSPYDGEGIIYFIR